MRGSSCIRVDCLTSINCIHQCIWSIWTGYHNHKLHKSSHDSSWCTYPKSRNQPCTYPHTTNILIYLTRGLPTRNERNSLHNINHCYTQPHILLCTSHTMPYWEGRSHNFAGYIVSDMLQRLRYTHEIMLNTPNT